MNIQEYVDIKDYSTLKIGGQFRYFVVVSSIEELNSVYAIARSELKYKNTPIFILGGGSNIVFSDGVINTMAVKIEIKGFEIIPDRNASSIADAGGNETHEYTDIKVGAGEIWDSFVQKTIEMNLSGLESLSAIPGTVGATPVQNVGAYGAEVKDTITEVEVFDIKENKIKNLRNEDCEFGYRDSIFKNKAKGRYAIVGVSFRLKKVKDNNELLKKREEIIKTRWSKLPDPKEIPNVGSFFKNPIVPKESFPVISKTYDQMPHFDVGDNMIKIPAGWLIENVGLKGESFGRVSVYDKNALVLINNGNATKEDLINAKNIIIKTVKDKFGITLEQEPEII